MHVMKIKENPTPCEASHLSNEELLVWLMEKYGDMVLRLAYTYVKNKQLAEDISQEVFISCYKNMDQFQQKASYKTWLYRIAVNRCTDVVKSWSYRNIYYKDFFSFFLKSEVPLAEENMIENEEKEMIFQKVLTLPLKLREVIILYYYEDLSIDEIATLLHINENTIKTRLHRARNSLKTTFEGSDFYEK
ncbi:sigma-70 family RNA polymerase sigma factor [Neobacillus sp. KR4-4]|uniref:sigma-70 family RNA polymerase sigma factor n=1 Tax=Neobacillus sp. KR4-4 TaxID=3344872 RepID=UPI0035CAD555